MSCILCMFWDLAVLAIPGNQVHNNFPSATCFAQFHKSFKVSALRVSAVPCLTSRAWHLKNSSLQRLTIWRLDVRFWPKICRAAAPNCWLRSMTSCIADAHPNTSSVFWISWDRPSNSPAAWYHECENCTRHGKHVIGQDQTESLVILKRCESAFESKRHACQICIRYSDSLLTSACIKTRGEFARLWALLLYDKLGWSLFVSNRTFCVCVS